MPLALKPSDLEYVCLHEAGHAVAAYLAGGRVEFIELLPEETAGGRARTRVSQPKGAERTIAAGGFAVEYLLYKEGRLLDEFGVEMTEKGFIDSAMNNSIEDKIKFFGVDLMGPDGTWPADRDVEYMTFGMFEVARRIEPMFGRVEALAQALQEKGRVEQSEIELILFPP